MTAMAERYPSLAVCKGRDATLRSPPPKLYSCSPSVKGTINAHSGIHHTSIMLHSLQPAISAINDPRNLMHRIRITNPIAITPISIARVTIARARTDAIFESVDPDVREVAVGLVGVAEEVVRTLADDGIVGRG